MDPPASELQLHCPTDRFLEAVLAAAVVRRAGRRGERWRYRSLEHTCRPRGAGAVRREGDTCLGKRLLLRQAAARGGSPAGARITAMGQDAAADSAACPTHEVPPRSLLTYCSKVIVPPSASVRRRSSSVSTSCPASIRFHAGVGAPPCSSGT